MTSNNAPFATAGSAISEDPHKGGRRKIEGSNERKDAPFATNYPEQREETPSKHVGRRRYEAQDAKHEAPFATGASEPYQEAPPPAAVPAPAPSAADTGRQQPIKHQDHSDVFRYDGGSNDTPSRPGRRRYEQERQDAPFATFGGSDDRNGSADTPRSAGGRRRFEDKLAKQPAPFALDDGDRFKNNNGAQKKNNVPEQPGGAGARRQERNVPPPNSRGEGVANRSAMQNCPFALN